MANTGCLEGMNCPKCGSEGPFAIEMSCFGVVYDNGIEDTQDFEWDDTNYCHCKDCGYDGTVRDFKERHYG